MSVAPALLVVRPRPGFSVAREGLVPTAAPTRIPQVHEPAAGPPKPPTPWVVLWGKHETRGRVSCRVPGHNQRDQSRAIQIP